MQCPLPMSSFSGESSKISESDGRKGEPGQFPRAPKSANSSKVTHLIKRPEEKNKQSTGVCLMLRYLQNLL